jgi:hypothetical protein
MQAMRKRCKRKCWDPALNPVKQANAVRLFDGDTLSMKVSELLTLDELKAGQLSAIGVHVLRCMSAISLRLAEDGVGPEAVEACRKVNRLLPAALLEGRVSDELLSAAVQLHEYHQAQRDLADRISYAKAAAPYTRFRN